MRTLGTILKQHLTEIDLRYLRRWLIVAGLLGVAAGLSSIALTYGIEWATKLFLAMGAGFNPPVPAGEGATVVSTIAHRWMIPVVTTVGGLLVGLIIQKLGPEAGGQGIDNAIIAFHHNEGNIGNRVPFVKLLASSITIGSGGSAGREGPMAHIAAAFGSMLGRLFKLTVQERRMAVAAGIGAGIGAIFKAPLGGAILASEILYLEGFETGALIPAFMASIIGYTIYASVFGFGPIFGVSSTITFNDPTQLIYYAILGLVCGLIGLLYPMSFFNIKALFNRLPAPKILKPAIGGALVGIMGLFLPQVLGMGYGWLQITMAPQTVLSLGIIIALIFGKMIATGLTLGSGGSGGDFAPGLMIGGLVGAALWTAFHGILPHMPDSPAPFVIVGMMALLGGVARAPLAVMFMVGEMAGSYSMLAPAMFAIGISYIIIGHHTLYEAQLPSPAASPAHAFEFSFPLMRQITVRDAMNPKVTTINAEMSASSAMDMLLELRIKSMPVLNDHGSGELAGIVTTRDVLRTPRDARPQTLVADIMTKDVITIQPEESLDTAMDLMSQRDIASLPVIDPGAVPSLVGIITRADISRAYASMAKKLIKRGAPLPPEPVPVPDRPELKVP